MSTLLVLRERLRKLYAEHTIFIVKILQFIMGLLLFWMINSILSTPLNIFLYQAGMIIPTHLMYLLSRPYSSDVFCFFDRYSAF